MCGILILSCCYCCYCVTHDVFADNTGSAIKVLTQWRKEKRAGCTGEYVLAVRRAITMFRHCWVVDETTNDVINYNPFKGSDNNSAFDIDQFLDPKPDVETALGIHRGDLHPHSLIWANEASPRPDPLQTFAADERTAAAVPLPTVSSDGCTDPLLLKKFHLHDFPPYDRALTKAELQHLLVLPPAEVPHSGMFDADGKWDREKTMRLFLLWKRRNYKRPARTTGHLKQFLRTRGKNVPQCSRQQILDMVEDTLRDECFSKNKAVRLFHTPYDDGLAEKKRRQVCMCMSAVYLGVYMMYS